MKTSLLQTLFGIMLSLLVGTAFGFPAAPYLPLADGNYWTYRISGSDGSLDSETVVVQGGAATYNGVSTKGLRWTGGLSTGYTEYYSNDTQGIRLHAATDPSDGGSTLLFSGGIRILPADIVIGQSVTSGGSVPIQTTPAISSSLNFSANATALGMEAVTVPAGSFTALKVRIQLTLAGTIAGVANNESVTTTYWIVANVGVVKQVDVASDGVTYTSELINSNLAQAVSAPSAASLSSAVIPSGSAIQLGSTTQTWGAIINSGSQTAINCRVSLATPVPVTLGYRAVSGAVQSPSFTRPINTPIDVPAGGVQVFLVTMTPTQAMAPTDVAFNFGCDNAAPAKIVPTLNTFILSASTTPVPNVLALVGTTLDGNENEDAMVDLRNGSGQFVVATSNIGSGGPVTVSGELYAGFAGPAPTLTVCQLVPGSTTCIAPPTPSVTVTLSGADQPAFKFFVTASGEIPDSPETNRILVRFKDSGGVVRGGTQTAIRSR